MTAVDLDAAKERLAAALTPYRWLADDDRDVLADALLPVVQALVAEGAAQALEDAAGDYLANTEFLDPMREMRRGDVATDLMWRASTTRDRAAALRAAGGEGGT